MHMVHTLSFIAVASIISLFTTEFIVDFTRLQDPLMKDYDEYKYVMIVH